MATSKTLTPTNVTISIPAFTDQPDQRVTSNCIDKEADAINVLSRMIGGTYNTTATVTATGNTALKRLHNQWSNVVSAIKTAHGLTTSSGMVNITGRLEFPANGTASALGTFFYWGVLNCTNSYGTMYLYQYHNSPLYIYRNHGTTANGSTVNETAADLT